MFCCLRLVVERAVFYIPWLSEKCVGEKYHKNRMPELWKTIMEMKIKIVGSGRKKIELEIAWIKRPQFWKLQSTLRSWRYTIFSHFVQKFKVILPTYNVLTQFTEKTLPLFRNSKSINSIQRRKFNLFSYFFIFSPLYSNWNGIEFHLDHQKVLWLKRLYLKHRHHCRNTANVNLRFRWRKIQR